MKTITIMSPKGGIGKTTTSDSIAYILGAEHRKRVLLLDCDPQGDTSRTFGCYEPDGIGMSELLERHVKVGGKYRTADLIRQTEAVDLIPANDYLMATAMKLSEYKDSSIRLSAALEEVAENYDYCICDCGRLLDFVVANAIMAADIIIAPVKIGGYEIKALETLHAQMRGLRPEIKVKVLLAMRQSNKASMRTEEDLKLKSGYDMLRVSVRRSVIAEKSTVALEPLPKYSPRCTATQDYRKIVEEIVAELEDQ